MAYIPQNYNDNGNWFGGLLKKRNTIEACVWAVFILFILNVPLAILTFKVKLIIFIITAVPGVITLMIGCGDETFGDKIIEALTYQNTRCSVTLKKPERIEEPETNIGNEKKKKGQRKEKKDEK